MAISIARKLADFAAKLSLPIPLSLGGTGKSTEFRKGHIDGLRLVYTGDRTLTVEAGSAYVSSTGKIVELTADKVFSGLSLTASAFSHAYLFENNGVADVELVATAPVKSWGTTYIKTGDTSRRYLGSVLTSSNGDIFGFRHYPQLGRMKWIAGSPGLAPFVVYGGLISTTPVLVTVAQLSPVMPLVVTTNLTCLISGVASALFSPADQVISGSSGGSNWTEQANAGSQVTLDINLARSGPNIGQFYAWSSGAGATHTVYALGYIFER